MGGADIGHDGDTHSGESGDETTGSPDKKADACRKIFEVADCAKKKESDARNGLQLTIEVGGGTFLDRGGDHAAANPTRPEKRLKGSACSRINEDMVSC